MKKVLMYNFSNFPCGDSTANRIYGLSKSFEAIEIKPIVTTIAEKEGNYNGIEYISLYPRKMGRVKKKLYRISIKNFFDNYAHMDEIEYIYMTYRSFNLINYMYLRKKRKKIIVDATEWYSPSQFRFGVFNPKYIKYIFRIKHLMKKCNVICVSQFFKDYYHHGNSILIPPQIDKKEFEIYNKMKCNNNEKITIFYGGYIPKKDYIGLFIKSVITDKWFSERFDFTIAGMTKKELKRNINYKKLKLNEQNEFDKINFLGKIPRDILLKKIHDSNFTILLRPIKRYSIAGFPSKVPESLACSTPLICNYSSDLKEYLIDGYNSIIIRELNKEEIINTLKKVEKMSKEDLLSMKKNAYISSNGFSYEYICNKLTKFIEDL